MKTLRLSAVLIIALAVATAAFCAGYRVVRVTDGDTIKVTKDEKVLTVRLVGIDAPERGRGKHKAGQPYSRKATEYLAGLVLNKEVTFKDYGVDRYGRTLAEVFVGGTNVNLEMVKAGYAEVYRGRPAIGFSPAPYQNAEKDARDRRKGMWVQNSGDYISPKTWRKTHREGSTS